MFPNDPAFSKSERPVQWLMATHVFFLVAIVLAMTPFTNNLDDIKALIYFIAGPLLAVVVLGLILFRHVPAPPRSIVFAFIAYGAALLVSTLASRYRWAGWNQCLFFWCGAGFFFSAYCIAASPRRSVSFTRCMTLMLLVVCLIGFFMFDFSHPKGEHHSLLTRVFKGLYGDASSTNALYQLLFTLQNADTDLQSTILNRDFFAGFCLMWLPFAWFTTIGFQSRLKIFWVSVGLFTSLITVACIFFTQSKFNYFVGIIIFVSFALLFFRFSAPAERKLPAAFLLILTLCLTVALSIFDFKRLSQLHKSVYPSLDSFGVIWMGALNFISHYPLLGGGPGTFQNYFQNYRAPDYYNHGIANVTSSAHNIFLDVMSDAGIIGLAAFIFLLAGLLVPLWRNLRYSDPRVRQLSILGALSMLSVIGVNLFSPLAIWPVGISSIWTIFGFAAGLSMQTAQPIEAADNFEPAPAPPAIRGNLVVLTLIAFFIFPLSLVHGGQTFRSALAYAAGLQMMEDGMQALTKSQEAERQRAEDLLRDSAEKFTAAIRKKPSNISAYYKLGSIYSTLSRIHENAAEQARRANQLEKAGYHQANAEQSLADAIETYERLARYSPDYAEIHYNFGLVYGQAAKMLRKIPAPSALTATGRDYAQKAMKHLSRMLELSNKSEIRDVYNEVYADLVAHYPDLAAQWKKAEPSGTPIPAPANKEPDIILVPASPAATATPATAPAT